MSVPVLVCSHLTVVRQPAPKRRRRALEGPGAPACCSDMGCVL